MTTPERVTADDLQLAATWLEEYETADLVDPTYETMQRVARWLRREAQRREDRQVVAATLRGAGVADTPRTRARVRAILAAQRAARASEGMV